jgi:hypothetical protein
MPTSYLALKPAPNPTLPNWLTWMKDNFSKISTEPSRVAALVGINKDLELVMLYKPIPIIALDGSLSAIIGNLNDEKSEPAFIKIDGANVGLAHAIQNFDKIPPKICPEIPLPSKFLTDTVWESAPKDIAICLFPVLAPVPFGAKIIETHSSKEEFVKNMATISPIHETWAKLISDTIEQHETNDENEKIFNIILQAKDT